MSRFWRTDPLQMPTIALLPKAIRLLRWRSLFGAQAMSTFDKLEAAKILGEASENKEKLRAHIRSILLKIKNHPVAINQRD